MSDSASVPLLVRTARPQDYDAIAAVADQWWGRPIVGVLPRLFLDHFWSTSMVATDARYPASAEVTSAEVTSIDELAAVLVGFVSPADPSAGYIHFVGVAPEHRGRGVGRDLYHRFFDLARARGCRTVSCVTSPVNTGSIAFHQRMGFSTAGPIPDYDGPGHDLMAFRRAL